ncbi:hypothetical protein DRO91_05555 [Candidatus Heimdallarchaeota archaeon]|nr:MAG: hypothetical protein DRO91_05555 [Candidatus Heimdallarchaeota archaeon]
MVEFSRALKKAMKGKKLTKELTSIYRVLLRISMGIKKFPAKDLAALRHLEKSGFVKPKRRTRSKNKKFLLFTGYVLTNKGKVALRQFL